MIRNPSLTWRPRQSLPLWIFLYECPLKDKLETAAENEKTTGLYAWEIIRRGLWLSALGCFYWGWRRNRIEHTSWSLWASSSLANESRSTSVTLLLTWKATKNTKYGTCFTAHSFCLALGDKHTLFMFFSLSVCN